MMSTARLLIRSSKLAPRTFARPSLNASLSTAAYDDLQGKNMERTVFPLPNERSKSNIPGQGWTVDTVVKTSVIPGAGHGRHFDVDVPQDTIVAKKRVLPMSKVSSLHDIATDTIVVFDSQEEIEKYVSLYEKEGHSRKEMFEYFSNFMGSGFYDGTVFVSSSSIMTNHAGSLEEGLNIRFILDKENGLLMAHTIVDVKKGDEICNHYRQFDHMPEFYSKLCKKEGTMDVVTKIKQFVGL